MKSLIRILFFLITFNSSAQFSVYHPFPDSSASWNIEVWSSLGGSWSYSYFLNGDSIVNTIVYHKLITVGQGNAPVLIRQDIPNKKLYILSPFDTTDRVLYDFNLQVGDTFELYRPNYYCSLWTSYNIVTSIDSVLIGNNYRKRWNFHHNNADVFIEGIGSTNGLLEAVCMNGAIPDLTCFVQNGNTLYPDSSTPCSLINTANYDIENNITVSIHPNPILSDAIISIDGKNNSSLYLKIYDVIGNIIFEDVIKNQTTVIDRKYLKPGLYIYQLADKNEKVSEGKFIVQ